MLKFDREKLRNRQEATWLLVDLIMLVLLLVNLSWLIFDWLFALAPFAALIEGLSEDFHQFYAQQIHPNYLQYDLVFVSIFIGELLVRWGFAIKNHSYTRWYWYPFIHWYEVLGCIPLTGFRALRLLRILSMLYRLQHLGVIDLKQTRAGKLLEKNYDVLMEHIADKVVLNVIDGIQDEIRHGQPVVRHILESVISPRRHALSSALAGPVTANIEKNFTSHKDRIRSYLDRRISEAIEASDDISQLEKVPVIGSYTIDLLERSISDIVYSIVQATADDITRIDNQQLIENVISASIEMVLVEYQDLDSLTEEIFLESLDVIKERVKHNKALERMQPAWRAS